MQQLVELFSLISSYTGSNNSDILIKAQILIDGILTFESELTKIDRNVSQLYGKEIKSLPTLDSLITPRNLTVLTLAVSKSFIELVELLIKVGASVNPKGIPPLYSAISLPTSSMAELLLRAGADVNFENPYNGEIPLTRAAYDGREDLVILFIAFKAVIDKTEKTGETALYYAVKLNYTNIAKILLQSGADPKKRCVSQSYLDWAIENRNPEMVDLFLKAKVDCNLYNNDGETPLIKACIKGNLEIVNLLLNANADPNLITRGMKQSPLYFAIEHNYPGIVAVLIKAKASFDVYLKKTPLEWALRPEKIKIISQLIKTSKIKNRKNFFDVLYQCDPRVNDFFKCLALVCEQPDEIFAKALPNKRLQKAKTYLAKLTVLKTQTNRLFSSKINEVTDGKIPVDVLDIINQYNEPFEDSEEDLYQRNIDNLLTPKQKYSISIELNLFKPLKPKLEHQERSVSYCLVM